MTDFDLTSPAQPTLPVDVESASEDATETVPEAQEATFRAATEPVPAETTAAATGAVTEAPSQPSDEDLVRLVTETHAMVKDMHSAFTEIAPSLISMTESLSKGGVMGMMGKMFGA